MLLWTALLLGLVGGLHCAGMCGPLMIALPGVGDSPGRFFAGRVVYQLGRIATYTVLGLVAGLVGRSLALAGVQRWVSLSLGALMLASVFFLPKGLDLPWLAPRFGALQRLMARLIRQRTFSALLGLGALNGLLPCGLVYAACAGAAATGTWWAGAEYMLAFGFGTLPMMLGMSLSGRILPPWVRLRLRHLVPISVGIVGCLLILRGLSLGIPYLSPDLSGAGAACCGGSGVAP